MKRFQVSLTPQVYELLERFRLAQRYVPERSTVIEQWILDGLAKEGITVGGDNGQ
jgi:metal-responsive CopG/Arc/MetJ family transcriptional regulator